MKVLLLIQGLVALLPDNIRCKNSEEEKSLKILILMLGNYKTMNYEDYEVLQ